MQYVPMLSEAGVQVTVRPLFPDSYVAGLQQQRRNVLDIGASYLARVRQLLTDRKYDLVWIEKELWPWMPMPLERLFCNRLSPVALDYDDAVFHSYDQHRSPLI